MADGHIMNPLDDQGHSTNESIDSCSLPTHITDFPSKISPVKYSNRKKCIYLFGGFVVSSCLVAVACAVLVMFIVFREAVLEVEVLAQPGNFSSFHHEAASTLREDSSDMRCINATIHRLNARAKYAAVKNFDRHIEKRLKPVCCDDIPKGKCKDFLPYEKTFFPNDVASSPESALEYLESVVSFMECDPHSLYVFCAMVYPACILDPRQVMPCKSVCDSVITGCQDVNASQPVETKLSCDNYPVGKPDEIVCRSTSYAINLDIGEEFEFSSPNYPNEIAANSNLVWSITSPEHTRVHIEFEDVNIDGQQKQYLTTKFGQNPYGSSLHRQRITEDRVVLTHLNYASVIFQSGNETQGSTGFTARATVLRHKDTLLCEKNARPIREEDLCDGVYDCIDCEGESECKTCRGDGQCLDEWKCRPPCGYHIMMSTEEASEILTSPPYSGSYEDCIYSFNAPSRFRARLEFLDYSGLVNGCNFKYGFGNNPFNEASEFSILPEISKEINFPDDFGWIWLASSSVNTSFVVRLTAFSDDLVIDVGADEAFMLDTTIAAPDVINSLARGTIAFKAPSGYHFTFSCINDVLDLNLNNIMIGIGAEPMKHDVYDIYGDNDDVVEFFSDAIWLKMYGNGPYEIGFNITTVRTKDDHRHSVLVDETTTIVFPIPPVEHVVDCEDEAIGEDKQENTEIANMTTVRPTSTEVNAVENGKDETIDVRPNVVSKTWIVTSVRHSLIAVKFLYFNSSSSKFIYITVGHGLNPDDSGTILFNAAVKDYTQKLPDDFIVKYPTFWIRLTSLRDSKDIMFSLKVTGIASIGNLVCSTKLDVTNTDICDDEYDCPDLSDESNCGDKGQCGQRPSHNRQKRVIGGTEATLGEYPWHGLIMVDGYSHCGSTLLNKDFAITASHCLWRDTNSASKLDVLYASISSEKFSDKHLVAEVSTLYLHPEDVSLNNPMDHDIALIKFRKPVPFTNYVRPACLLLNETQFQPGHRCYISGFGRQVIWSLAKELHGAPLTLYSNDKCMDFQSNLFKITDNIVCAGERDGGVGTCYGDSGGPLVCPDDNDTFYLRGLTSFGHTCANRYRPGAFTRIGRYLDFINMIMESVSTDK